MTDQCAHDSIPFRHYIDIRGRPILLECMGAARWEAPPCRLCGWQQVLDCSGEEEVPDVSRNSTNSCTPREYIPRLGGPFAPSLGGQKLRDAKNTPFGGRVRPPGPRNASHSLTRRPPKIDNVTPRGPHPRSLHRETFCFGRLAAHNYVACSGSPPAGDGRCR